MSKARVLHSESVFEGKVVHLAVESIELPGGKTTDLEIIRHPGAAAAVPLTADGNVLLVKQYRHATDGWLLEVPAGKLDPGEDPALCALREVEEEVGVRAADLVPLGWIWTTPGFTDEKIWLYLARDLNPGEQDLQPDEVLSVVLVPLADAVQKVHQGEIRDAKSVCCLLRVQEFLSSSA